MNPSVKDTFKPLMKFPLITFVMPCFNDGSSVKKAIDSIFDQDYPMIRVVAINDGSTDDTKKILNKLAQKYSKLSIIDFENNRGACVARNEGAKLAKTFNSDYYAWLP